MWCAEKPSLGVMVASEVALWPSGEVVELVAVQGQGPSHATGSSSQSARQELRKVSPFSAQTRPICLGQLHFPPSTTTQSCALFKTNNNIIDVSPSERSAEKKIKNKRQNVRCAILVLCYCFSAALNTLTSHHQCDVYHFLYPMNNEATCFL